MYKLVENKDREETTRTGKKVTISTDMNSKYSINYVAKGHNIRVLDIKDYMKDPIGIGNGLVKLLNSGKIKIPLDV